MFGILGADLPPNKLHLGSTFFHLRSTFVFSSCQFIMDLSKYTECLSQWPAHIPAGLPTYGALLLLAAGALQVGCHVWTFVRVLLSLFVLPGKPV